MKSAPTILRVASLFISLVTVALWFFGGMNSGWTKTSEAVKSVDPVTGLEAIHWETRFLPGLDFLAAGLVFGAVLLVAGVVMGRRLRNG